MIDIRKKYCTKSGKRVIGLEYVPFNSCGYKVTYPIKGSIVVCEKPVKLKFCIWSENGIFDIVWNNQEELNLIKDNS
jgi:hypothetical protein